MIDPSRPDYGNTPVSARRPSFDYAPAQASEPHVSIVTPFYNTGAQFHETATSVFRQSLQQWEWIIVNDGSNAREALDVLNAYRGRDPRIRVIDLPETRGPGAARNTGYRAAKAALVLQLDSDNLLEPTAAEKWSWYLDANPECAFVNGFGVGFGAREYLWDRGFHEGRTILQYNLVDGTSLVRRSVHAAAGGYDESIRGGLEDWHFWLRCANAGYWGTTVPEFLNWYRRRPTHADRWVDWDEGGRQAAFKRRLRAEFPALWKKGFPAVPEYFPEPNADVPEKIACANPLTKARQRLLLVVPWFAMGGSDTFNVDLVSQLAHRGWEVTLASTLRGQDEWGWRFAALTPDIFAMHRFLKMVDYPRFLSYLIQSRRVDVVMVSHSEFGYRLLLWLRSRHPGVSFVDYCHNVEPTWNAGGYPTLSVRHHEQLDLSVVSSEALRSWMVDRGAEPERVATCHTNVDTDAVHPDDALRATVRSERGVGADTPVILFAGRVCAQKQPQVLAGALARVKQRSAGFVAWVAGDGPELESLRRSLRARGIQDEVRLLGKVSHEEVLRLMAAADILFLPSAYEGIALVLYEAMASGLAVVGADVGGQRELVTDECGVLIAPGDPATEAERYAGVLSDLLADGERRRAMGRAGRERVAQHFRIGQMGARVLELLARVDTLRRTSPRPVVTPAMGRPSAEAAVEIMRLSALTDYLWIQRGARGGLRKSVHAVLSRWYTPVYEWGEARGWNWIPRAAKWARRVLLGRERLG